MSAQVRKATTRNLAVLNKILEARPRADSATMTAAESGTGAKQ